MTEDVEKVKRRSLVSELLELLADNPTITTSQAATILGCKPRTIEITRSSDSFRALLALRIDRLHGDAMRAVRNNTLLAANDALNTARIIMGDPATIGSLKLEAAKLALENHARMEERHMPKGSAVQPAGTNVTVNLTFEELQTARESSLARGATLDSKHRIAPMSLPSHSPRSVYSPASVKMGLRYEEKVCLRLARIFGPEVSFQVPMAGGYADAVIRGYAPKIIEVKLTQTLEGYEQLIRYSKVFQFPVSRILITRTIILTTPTPERPTYLRKLEDIHNVAPGGYYVIPFDGKNS